MMKIKIKITALLLLFLFAFNSRSQSFITIDGAQTFSNFKFVDSGGEKDKNFTTVLSGAYSLGYRLSKKSGALLRFNAGIRKGGAGLNYNNSDITWNLQYCDLRFGGGYELNKWRVKPYLSAAAYYSFLLKATQNMDGLNFNLKTSNDLKNTDFGILIIPGVKAFVSDYISLYSEFTYLIGLQNIETDEQQKLYNKSFMITLGIAATFTKSKPKWIQGKR